MIPLLLSCLYLLIVRCTADAQAVGPLEFADTNDLPQQRKALLNILQAVGKRSDIGLSSSSLAVLGYSGTTAWGVSNVSYCWWWGISCCGQPFEQQLCSLGPEAGNSVSSIRLPAAGLQGTLPDVFESLPDLQALDVSFNRGDADKLLQAIFMFAVQRSFCSW